VLEALDRPPQPLFPQVRVLPAPLALPSLPAERQVPARAELNPALLQVADPQWALELMLRVTQQTDVRAVAHVVLSEIASHLRPDLVGSLFLVEPEVGKMRLYASYRLNLMDSEELMFYPQEMFGRVAYESLRPSRTDASELAPILSAEVLQHHRGRAPQEVVALPLIDEGRCFGLLNLEHYDRLLPLDETDVQRAVGYLALVAPVLRQAQLYEQSRMRELDLIQLNKVLHAVNATLDIEEILKTIRRALGHSYRFDSIAVLLIEPEQHELRFQYVHGHRVTPEQQAQYRALRLPLTGDSVHVRAIARQEPFQISDLEPTEPMSPFDRAAYEVAPFRSAVVFPLVLKGQPIGTIAFVNRAGRTQLVPGQLAYLQRFVSQVVTAIENTRQLDGARAAQRELQIKHLAIQSQSAVISAQHSELVKKSEALFEQSRELEALVKILQVVNEEMALGPTMQAVLDEGLLLIPGAERGAFMWFDPEVRAFRCAAQRGYPEGSLDALRLGWRQATERFTPAEGERHPDLYVVSGAQLEPLPRLEGFTQPAAILTLALTVKGALQGFLVFDSIQSVRAFDRLDAPKLQRLLEHATAAFYKARYLEQIEAQKEALQSASHKINDSLAYARRILQAILPRGKDLAAALGEHFVLFEPRDVVSGDFYWLSTHHGRVMLAAVDCTGHGIPGAFMSVLGNTLLNHVVNEKGITDPGQILNELDTRVKRMLGQFDAESDTLDGMDVALWTLDPATGLLQFAGANRPLLHWRRGGLTELKGQRRPVGGVLRHGTESFKTQSLQLEAGDMVYTFTDGITDQFGGQPPKKFLSARFRSVLESVGWLPAAQQRSRLWDEHLQWRGTHAQMDDILVLGVRYVPEGAA